MKKIFCLIAVVIVIVGRSNNLISSGDGNPLDVDTLGIIVESIN